jgi:ABC-type sugar transport system permease subunit
MNTLQKRKNQFIYTCLLIPVVLLLMFVVYPALDLIRMSFTDWDGLSLKQNFIGVQNYITMFINSPDLWLSLKNNFVYFFVHLCAIPLELMAAVMLNTKFRGAKFFRSMTFLPYIINGVAIAYAFSYFYSPINGAFNAILTEIGLKGAIHNWLSDEGIINYVLASVSLWKYSGYHIIMFIAALQSIPQDIMEAATVDGAGAWQKFKAIQIPSIQLVIDFILFDNVRGALQIFDIPFVMTNGGPGYSSSTFTLYTINTAFKYNNFGLAATMAVTIMLLIIIVYTIQSLFINVIRKGGH